MPIDDVLTFGYADILTVLYGLTISSKAHLDDVTGSKPKNSKLS